MLLMGIQCWYRKMYQVSWVIPQSEATPFEGNAYNPPLLMINFKKYLNCYHEHELEMKLTYVKCKQLVFTKKFWLGGYPGWVLCLDISNTKKIEWYHKSPNRIHQKLADMILAEHLRRCTMILTQKSNDIPQYWPKRMGIPRYCDTDKKYWGHRDTGQVTLESSPLQN